MAGRKIQPDFMPKAMIKCWFSVKCQASNLIWQPF